MLMPISQTCGQLRTIALDSPSLWTSVGDWPRRLSQLFLQRSQGLPLKTFLPNPTLYVHDLGPTDTAKELLLRVRELDLGGLETLTPALEHLFSLPLPNLERLSVQFVEVAQPEDADESGQYLFELPLTQERLPRLRRLYLGACDLASYDTVLSSLTHLALHVINVPLVHAMIAAILPECHSLQSLHIEEVEDQDDLFELLGGYRHLPTVSVVPSCGGLRRVSLLSMYNRLAFFILSLVLADQPQLAVQLHKIYPDSSRSITMHHHRLLKNPSQVVIGRYPQPAERVPGGPYVWGMTASGSEQRTLRMVGETLDEVAGMLREGGAATLAGVRELWLTDVSPAACDEPNTLPTADVAALSTLVKSMPTLEAVTLVNQFQAPWTGAPPSLRLLPSVHEDAVSVPRPATVRISYGYGVHVLNWWFSRPHTTPAVRPLDLTGLLEELSSGAYDYIRHLVLETPPLVNINAGDVDRLRALCETVEMRVADETPTMALPAYCDEPAAWPSNEPWPYRLWLG
ncbi:hypothetical protein TRAPUB_1180 [Trametes pubescens]|uniref:F-box domain-containing protein n=1 Tax=Trametes pubescens TaxID=154538 RepID=A0A1M2VK40_TRAPU|nr:hypothetical protein TRAPUB_1180 [Trametes pubescens]